MSGKLDDSLVQAAVQRREWSKIPEKERLELVTGFLKETGMYTKANGFKKGS